MKRPNGIVPKTSRGLFALRSRRGKGGVVTAEELRSIKLGIVPGGDLKGEARKQWNEERKKAAKAKKGGIRLSVMVGKGAKMRASRDAGALNPKSKAKVRVVESDKPRILPDLSKKRR